MQLTRAGQWFDIIVKVVNYHDSAIYYCDNNYYTVPYNEILTGNFGGLKHMNT